MAIDLAEFIIKSIVGQSEVVLIEEAERNNKRSRGLVIRAIRTLVTSDPSDIEDVVVEAIPAG
jgi:predicted RNA-binding protein YlqC (UPF0109 family)